MAAIEVSSLTVRYGDVVAVDRLSFTAEAGRVTCMLGRNGAGKTSTIECLEGLRSPTSGHVSVIGLDPRRDRRALVPRIGVMLQEGGVYPAARPLEVLQHAAALYRRPLAPGMLVERLGLTGLERRTWRQLSGGEQRRLTLGLALVGRPQVAFLDEPTAGVDPAGRQTIREVIGDLRANGATVLLTTHDLDEAERIADDIVIIDGSRLVARGTLAELVRPSGAGDRVRFSAPAGIDVAALAGYVRAPVVQTTPGHYEVGAVPRPTTVAAITAWLAENDIPLDDLHASRQRLEDVFLRLTSATVTSARRPPIPPPPIPVRASPPPAPTAVRVPPSAPPAPAAVPPSPPLDPSAFPVWGSRPADRTAVVGPGSPPPAPASVPGSGSAPPAPAAVPPSPPLDPSAFPVWGSRPADRTAVVGPGSPPPTPAPASVPVPGVGSAPPAPAAGSSSVSVPVSGWSGATAGAPTSDAGPAARLPPVPPPQTPVPVSPRVRPSVPSPSSAAPPMHTSGPGLPPLSGSGPWPPAPGAVPRPPGRAAVPSPVPLSVTRSSASPAGPLRAAGRPAPPASAGGARAANPGAVRVRDLRPLLAQLRLDVTLTLRNGESLLLTLGLPVTILVFFSLVDVLPAEGEPVDFLVPGMLSLAVLATAFTNLAITTGFDRSYGVLKRLGATPLGRDRLVAAKALAVLAVLALQITALGVAGLALGWRPAVEPVALAAAVVLGVVAFTGLALTVAGRLRALVALAAANAIFLAALLLSGMVFPLDELPGPLRVCVRALPSTALADAVRGALTEDTAVPGQVWPVLTIWAIAGVWLAATLFRWEPSD